MKLRTLMTLATLVVHLSVSGCATSNADADDSDLSAASVEVFGGFTTGAPASFNATYTSSPCSDGLEDGRVQIYIAELN